MPRRRRNRPRATTSAPPSCTRRLEGRAAGTCSRSRPSWNAPTSLSRRRRRRRRCPSLDRFIKLHPTSPALDYALYLRGWSTSTTTSACSAASPARISSERDQQASRDAYQAFKQLIDQFPKSTLCRRRARAHDVHRQRAGVIRGTRGALLLPPRRLCRGGQPRAAAR